MASRQMTGQIARKGCKAPIQADRRWPVERANAWHNAFNRLQRCYERRENVIDAFFDLADAIITVRSLIRRAWTTYRWDGRPARRPDHSPAARALDLGRPDDRHRRRALPFGVDTRHPMTDDGRGRWADGRARRASRAI
jgi:hypothetical protein